MKPSTASLFRSQRQLLRKGFLTSKENWVICTPTGAGKTLMAEWAFQIATSQGYRAVYLAPLKAIVEEKAQTWSERYADLAPGVFTGESTRQPGKRRPKREQLLLMTPEKLASYLHGWRGNLSWLAEIGLLVIDEFHTIGDTSRGATIESLVGRLQRINPFFRIIALSATIPNADQFATWLNAKEFVTTWRPVPLVHRTVRFRKVSEKPLLLEKEVMETVEKRGQVLVFVNSRRRSERLASHLCDAGYRAEFYHAGLNQEGRSLRHDAMARREIDALISTSSLEMGVNFPARKVVVYDSYVFNGETFGPLPIARYLQFAGRAGRFGLDSLGESVLFLPVWHGNALAYENGIPENVSSGLQSNRSFDKEVLTEITTRLSISEEHLETNFVKRTFCQRFSHSPHLETQIEELLKAELIKRSKHKQKYLVETPLGRIATQMDVSPKTIQLLVRFYDKIPSPCFFDILFNLCLCPEVTPKLPFHFEHIDQMTDGLLKTPSRLLDCFTSEVLELANNKNNTKYFLASINTAFVVHLHTMGESIESLAEHFDCYPVDIQMVKSNLDWLLATALRVFSHKWRQQWLKEMGEDAQTEKPLSNHEKIVKQLIPMVKYGLPHEGCDLVNVKGIGQKRAMALFNAGLTTLEKLCHSKPKTISRALGLQPFICSRLQEQARQILTDRKEDIPFEIPEGPTPLPPNEGIRHWPKGVDPYRLRRALDLRIVQRSEECLRVDGGTEPHTIRISTQDGKLRRVFACDCLDAAKGNLCKHVMRARLEYGQGQDLLEALQALQSKEDRPLRYSLGELWIQGAALYDRYEERQTDYSGLRFLARNEASKRWNR